MRITPLPELQSKALLPATDFARIDGLLRQQARLDGLAGPLGAGVPQAGRPVLAGDETAYPAMARIVQMRPDARAEVWLLGRSADYPLPARAGLRPRHLPGGGASLAAILRENPPAPEAHLWMAGEKTQIQQLRQLVHEGLGPDRHRTPMAAYWTARHIMAGNS